MKFDEKTDTFILERHDFANRHFQETQAHHNEARKMKIAFDCISNYYEQMSQAVRGEI